jgi:hypothetical protein
MTIRPAAAKNSRRSIRGRSSSEESNRFLGSDSILAMLPPPFFSEVSARPVTVFYARIMQF